MRQNMRTMIRIIGAIVGVIAILIAVFAVSGAFETVLIIFAFIMLLISLVGHRLLNGKHQGSA